MFPFVTSIKELCGLFGMTRQAWYKSQRRREAELINEGKVLEIVRAKRKAHTGLDRISGKLMYRIVKPELEFNKVKIGRDKFFEVLRKYGQLPVRKRFRPRTTISNVNLPLFPNLAEGMTITGPEQLWVSDITYLWIGNRFAYLSLVTDAGSHQVMGHCLSPTLETIGCMHALEMAISKRIYAENHLIHHSDRGFQYRSQAYRKMLRDGKIESSMTQTGDPLENAVAERLNGILKVDMGLSLREYESFEQAQEVVSATIETYNTIRPHSSVDYLVPVEAHKINAPLRNRWKKQPVDEAVHT